MNVHPPSPHSDQTCEYKSMKRFIALFLVVVVMRALLVAGTGIHPAPIPAIGADLIAAGVLYWVAPLLPGRIMRFAAVALIVMGYAAGAEHLVTHGTFFRMGHLGYLTEPAFIVTSAQGISLIWLAVFSFASLPLFWLLKNTNNLPPLRSAGLVGALIALVILSTDSLTTPNNNVVVGSLAQLPSLALSHPVALEPRQSDNAENAFYEASRGHAAGSGQDQNVLLIMVEGLSGAYLPAIADHHGFNPALSLPRLEQALNATGFRLYSNMLTHQRQTDRGTYPLLCADYPRMRLMPSEMTEASNEGGELDCLPQRLDQAGYRTAYLQAADLDFMAKDQFMPLAGFDRVIGNLGARKTVPEGNTEQSGWGASDRHFLRAALSEVESLDQRRQRWFATLLNVGTHHPFVNGARPADSAATEQPRDRQDRRRQAFAAMERALVDFLAELDERGFLRDTTVIITSDESTGFVRQTGSAEPLDSNFGMLAVRMADTASKRIEFRPEDQLTAQIDVPMTILDLTGARRGEEMIGRSLLNTDNGGRRRLIVGDTYKGRVHFVRSDGTALGCNESTLNCTSYRFKPARLFGSLERTNDPPFVKRVSRLKLLERTEEIRAIQNR